ncbi:hypothetical protein AVEN_190273-1 [Araneus ventricosus]|uniref:Uncharacterized protein n=1 Tax=Araneus ventricosus TaxID=182803 RepID=A0A4Y2IUP5_ARAVE|nr:hypothetical protein AVEN_190273-1 [Araneus ventricosus]
MLSASLLLRQKTAVLLILFWQALLQQFLLLNTMKHRKLFGGQLCQMWSSSGSSISLPSTSSPMNVAKDTIKLIAGSTGTVSNPPKSHSTTHSGQSLFQAEVRVLLVTSPTYFQSFWGRQRYGSDVSETLQE